MSVRFDPERYEINTLLDYVDSFAGKRVLEIGAGDGRLTRRFAELATHVTAIDPDPNRIDDAKEQLPEALQDRVIFQTCALAEFEPEAATPLFDVAIMSWSL